jgi:hypothetical protein
MFEAASTFDFLFSLVTSISWHPMILLLKLITEPVSSGFVLITPECAWLATRKGRLKVVCRRWLFVHAVHQDFDNSSEVHYLFAKRPNVLPPCPDGQPDLGPIVL